MGLDIILQALAQSAVTQLVQQPLSAWIASLWRRDCITGTLGVKFNGDLKQLAFFLIQVWNYMQEYRADLPNDPARVQNVTMTLEGEATEWIVPCMMMMLWSYASSTVSWLS